MRNKFPVFLLLFSLLHVAFARPGIDFLECKGKNGNFPKIGSLCRSYYKCKNWKAEELECSKGMHFFPEMGYCVWHEQYPCLEKGKVKKCPYPDGKFMKQGTKCKVYYDCRKGVPNEKKCAGELLFDTARGKCDWPELVTCPEEPKSKKCPQPYGKFLKPETGCKVFYDCRNGIATEMKCPKDQLFDPVKEKCEWPEIYICVEDVRSTEITNSESSQLPTTSMKPTRDSDESSSEEDNSSEEKGSTLTKSSSGTRKITNPFASTTAESTVSPNKRGSTDDCVKEIFLSSKLISNDSTSFTKSLDDDSTISTSEDVSTVSPKNDFTDENTKETFPNSKISDESTRPQEPLDDKSTISITEDIQTTPKRTSSTYDNDKETFPISKKTSDESTLFTKHIEDKRTFSTLEDISTVSPKSGGSTDDKEIFPNSKITSDESTLFTKQIEDKRTFSTLEDISTVSPKSGESTDGNEIFPNSRIISDESTLFTKQIEDIRTFSTLEDIFTVSPKSGGSTDDNEIFPNSKITSDESTFSTKHIEDERTDSKTITPGITDSVTLNIFCPEPEGHFPHPNNKHKFIICVGGNPIIMDCPADLVFDHTRRSCEYDKRT